MNGERINNVEGGRRSFFRKWDAGEGWNRVGIDLVPQEKNKKDLCLIQQLETTGIVPYYSSTPRRYQESIIRPFPKKTLDNQAPRLFI